MLEGVHSVLGRFSVVDSAVSSIVRERGLLEVRLQSLKDMFANLQKDIDIQEGSVLAFSQFLVSLSNEKLVRLKEILDMALQTVFFDRKYSVEFEIEDRGVKKTLNIMLCEVLDSQEVLRTEIDDSVGGGVLSIIGFIFRIYYVMYFDLRRILFLDEAFSMLSDHYIRPLILLMKSLSTRQGFKFVFITHDVRVLEYERDAEDVDVYEVHDHKAELKDVSSGEGDEGD